MLLTVLLLSPALRAQQIDSVGIQVFIYPDGSALISQNWKVEVVSGTEWYMPVTENNGIKVDYLHVVEFVRNPEWYKGAPDGVSPTLKVTYTEEGRNWNTNRTLEEKTYRCGLNPTPEGCELCWGQGSMGWHRWLAFIRIEGLVQSMNDYDGFNFMFLNPELVAPPRTATITVHNETGGPEWTAENIRFWGFGYKGSILLEDGKVVARTEEPLGTYDKMILMMRFDKGMLSPVNVRDIDFETMEKEAKKDSEWSPGAAILGVLFLGFIVDLCCGFRILLLLCGLIGGFFTGLVKRIRCWSGHNYKKAYFGTGKVDGYWRETPLDGDILQAAYILDKGLHLPPKNLPSRLISAYFLRWILDGKVQALTDTGGQTVLSFPEEVPEFDKISEKELYIIALGAALSNGNRVLEKDEFRKWAKKKGKSRLSSWCRDAFDSGRKALKEKGFIDDYKAHSKGIPELKRLVQFQNFLKDFTITSEREAVEVKLWKDYLVYAALFGIADRVAAQFKKLNPAGFEQFSTSSHLSSGALLSTVALSSSIGREIRTRPPAPAPVRSSYSYSSSSSHTYYGTSTRSSYSGRGGSSSYRGGGGYSGGGRGGGSR